MRTFWICLIAAAFSVSTAAPTVSAPTPDEEGKSLFETKCNTCHSVDRPKKKRKTRAGWEKTVLRMKNRNGCPIDDEQAKAIIDYLSKHYAPEK